HARGGQPARRFGENPPQQLFRQRYQLAHRTDRVRQLLGVAENPVQQKAEQHGAGHIHGFSPLIHCGTPAITRTTASASSASAQHRRPTASRYASSARSIGTTPQPTSSQVITWPRK